MEKQLKLKAKTSEKVNVHSYLLEHFDKELAALQEGKLGVMIFPLSLSFPLQAQ